SRCSSWRTGCSPSRRRGCARGRPGPMSREALYPVFLKLAGLPVVVVGGGAVAAQKLDGLLAAGARVTVIAPAARDEVRRRVTVIERAFRPSDLDGARWVVAAATPAVNREVAAAATTGGAAPALAGLLREALEAVLPHDVEAWLALAIRERAAWQRARVPIAERRPLLLRALERLYAGAP